MCYRFTTLQAYDVGQNPTSELPKPNPLLNLMCGVLSKQPSNPSRSRRNRRDALVGDRARRRTHLRLHAERVPALPPCDPSRPAAAPET